MDIQVKALLSVSEDPRALAYLRLVLGMLQITGVGMSLALLLYTGVTRASLVAVVCACLATCVSVLLFGGRSSRDSRR
jgi:hypothetical protein